MGTRCLAVGVVLLLACAAEPAREAPPPAPPASPLLVLEGAVEVEAGVWLVDFGSVEAGNPTERLLRLRNEGDAPATVIVFTRLSPFSLSLAQSTVAPGERADLRATFAPVAGGEAEGVGWIDGGAQRLEVRFAGRSTGGAAACIRTNPSHVAFGPIGVECPAAVELVEIENRCALPLPISLEVIGNGFSIQPGTPTRVLLQPQEQMVAPVLFDPAAPGFVEGALLVRDRLDEPLVSVGLTGAGAAIERAPHADAWAPVTRIPTAVLFVVDDGPAIAPWHERLAALGEQAAQDLEASHLELRIGATTASLAGPCARDGALLASQGSRVLTDRTPDLPLRLADLLSVEICEASAPPEPLRAAALALPHLLVAPFEPPDLEEWVLVYVVSASDDAGSEPVEDALLALQEVAPFRRIDVRVVHPSRSCGSEDEGTRLRAFAEAAFGEATPICMSRWPSSWMRFVETFSLGRLTQIPADRNHDGTVDADDLTVTVDGVETPPGEAWTYDPVEQRIRFDSTRLNPLDHWITARYEVELSSCGVLVDQAAAPANAAARRRRPSSRSTIGS